VKTTVPPGQQAAMQASYLLGKSIRQIAREMHRDPATVSKIVKSAQMDRIVLDMKKKFFGKLLPKALKSIQFALDEETDGRLGYQVLKDSGVTPNQKEMPKALKSIQFALDEETDGRLGYQVLKDSGVTPNQKEILEERALGARRTPPVARAIHASIQQD
jgi:1,4-dihydroxy-2-naphthoyl-CoA synthase